jgi:hypothetical protein
MRAQVATLAGWLIPSQFGRSQATKISSNLFEIVSIKFEAIRLAAIFYACAIYYGHQLVHSIAGRLVSFYCVSLRSYSGQGTLRLHDYSR